MIWTFAHKVGILYCFQSPVIQIHSPHFLGVAVITKLEAKLGWRRTLPHLLKLYYCAARNARFMGVPHLAEGFCIIILSHVTLSPTHLTLYLEFRCLKGRCFSTECVGTYTLLYWISVSLISSLKSSSL